MENQKSFRKSISKILITKISSIHIHHPDLKHLVWGINPIHVTLCAFIDGAADVISFELFGVYCTMMTGNFIKLAISLGSRNYFGVFLSSIVIVTYLTGCYISLILMDIFKADRRKSYLVCLPFQAIGLLCVGLVDPTVPYYPFTVIPLVFSFGLLNTWGNRIGYTPQMMTGNMQSLTNFIFTYVYLKKKLSNKEKADVIILSSLLVAYFCGCIISSVLLNTGPNKAESNARYATLGLLIAVVIKLFASKTYVVLECDKASCLSDGCPTSQFLFDNSEKLHPSRFDHAITKPVESNNHVVRGIGDDNEMKTPEDIHDKTPQELCKV